VSRSAVGILPCLLVFGLLTPAAAAPADAPSLGVVTVAGTGEEGYSGDGRQATDARVGDSGGIAVGPDGTLYIADSWSGRVRAVSGDGVIDTVPGTRALRSPETDGPVVNGWRYSPSDRPRSVAIGPDGTLYVAGSETIRRVARDGSVAKIVDTAALFPDDPSDIAVDGSGNLYVSGRDRVVRIASTGAVATIAGGGSLDPIEAEGRPATEAALVGDHLTIAAAADGVVYVVAPPDTPRRDVSSLHRVDLDGTLHTVAGGGAPGFLGDGGPARQAQISDDLDGLAVDADGDVHLFDQGNRVVRVIDADGRITSLAPPLPTEGLNVVSDLAIGPHGDVYVKVGPRVHRLVRDAKAPAPSPARAATYPSRFPDAEPGTVRTVAGNGHEEQSPDAPRQESPAPGRAARLAIGPDGTRYYADAAGNRVLKITAGGASVFAGTGKADFAGDGGPATRAALRWPTGVAVGQDGSVYIADSGNERLRKVTPDGVIATVAGDGSKGVPGGEFGEDVTVHGDGGPATAATVTPADVAVAGDGTLYIAEDDNMRISRVTPGGVISTFAGGGKRWHEAADGHSATEADFTKPSAIALGPDGSVYMLDSAAGTMFPAVRVVDRTGVIRTVAGDSYRSDAEAGFAGDGGPAARAELNNPQDIATGPDGSVYIADTYNGRVRAVDPAGTIRTVAGNGERTDSDVAINEPRTLAVGPDGVVHVVNSAGDRISVVAGGKLTSEKLTMPATAASSTPATKMAITPRSIAVDHDGGVLIASDAAADVLEVSRTGAVTHPLEGSPQVVTVAPDGTRYVVVDNVVYRVAEDGRREIVAGNGPGDEDDANDHPATMTRFVLVVDVAVSKAGRVYVATRDAVYRVADNGTFTNMYRTHGLVDGIAVDGEEHLYVTVGNENRVYRVQSPGVAETFAGTDTEEADNGDGGDATDAPLDSPTDVTADDNGNIYISTASGIRRVDEDGTIMTVAQGKATSLALDRHGDLYFADPDHNLVKVVVRPGELSSPFRWSTVIWPVVIVLALVALAWPALYWFRRRKSPVDEPAEPLPAYDSPEPPQS
jgi:sugar lactone lactonase YvrE